ncbi:MAG: DUF3592 domain-containing protein [Atopobiaceae bacterium]|nr:DUF3592 domain-containing protein [Atopobiaceae bacterium]
MGLFFLIFGVTLTLLGVTFLSITFFVARQRAGLEERCSASTEATLIDAVSRSTEYSNRVHVTQHGIYAYQTMDGMEVRAENENGYGLARDVPGPLVTILYNPNNPTEFFLPEEQASFQKSYPGLRRTGIALLVFGILLLVACVVFWAA